MHNLLRRCELLFRWEHTSQAAIHLDACTLGPGIFLQLGLEVSSLMPPQGKLNPMDDSREKLSRDISFVLVFPFWVMHVRMATLRSPPPPHKSNKDKCKLGLFWK